MKRALLVLAVLVAVIVVSVVGLVFVGPALVDPNQYKSEIANAIGERLGTRVRIEGPLTVAGWPAPQLRIEDVAIENPDRFKGDLLSAKTIFWKLVTERFWTTPNVGHLTARGIQFNWHRHRDGTTNLDHFLPQDTASDEPPSLPPIAGIEAKDIRIAVNDELTGQRISIDAVSFSTGRIAARKPTPFRTRLRATASKPSWRGDAHLAGSFQLDPAIGALVVTLERAHGATDVTDANVATTFDVAAICQLGPSPKRTCNAVQARGVVTQGRDSRVEWSVNAKTLVHVPEGLEATGLSLALTELNWQLPGDADDSVDTLRGGLNASGDATFDWQAALWRMNRFEVTADLAHPSLSELGPVTVTGGWQWQLTKNEITAASLRVQSAYDGAVRAQVDAEAADLFADPSTGAWSVKGLSGNADITQLGTESIAMPVRFALKDGMAGEGVQAGPLELTVGQAESRGWGGEGELRIERIRRLPNRHWTVRGVSGEGTLGSRLKGARTGPWVFRAEESIVFDVENGRIDAESLMLQWRHDSVFTLYETSQRGEIDASAKYLSFSVADSRLAVQDLRVDASATPSDTGEGTITILANGSLVSEFDAGIHRLPDVALAITGLSLPPNSIDGTLDVQVAGDIAFATERGALKTERMTYEAAIRTPILRGDASVSGDVSGEFLPSAGTFDFDRVALQTEAFELSGSAVRLASGDATPITGSLTVHRANPRQIADWLKLPIPTGRDAKTLTSASGRADFRARPGNVSLNNLEADVDDSRIRGWLRLQSDANTVVSLNVDRVAIDGYLPPPNDAPPAPNAVPLDWLRTLPIEGTVSIGQLRFEDTEIDELMVRLTANQSGSQ
ncbi:MAG: AsmA family protein [Pseudomonadota bacterium]